jgi:hypothetical protein
VPSDPNLFYDITTTAPHSGDIDVCITYNPAEIVGGIESNLKLFHFDGSQWVDITTSLNTSTNQLCGKTDHLSPFIVAHKAFLCGDANHSGGVSISDAVYLIKFIFSGGPAPSPLASGDVNCSGVVTISDVVYLINFIFAGGASPCAACP